MAMYKSGPRYTSGIGALEVVSPELRKALGIEKPQQFDPETLERLPREDETPRPFRPQGLGNIFLGEELGWIIPRLKNIKYQVVEKLLVTKYFLFQHQ